jgi:hypothetical protein
LNHQASPDFWAATLHFLRTYGHKRISLSIISSASYRALAIESGADRVWFWIITHADYDKLIG